jgi:hypothetical protein
MPVENQDTDVAAGNEDDVAADTLWGVPAIAKFIGLKKRKTDYLISKKIIPVKKHSHKITSASRAEIRAVFKPPHS